jgi:hypothetical protein
MIKITKIGDLYQGEYKSRDGTRAWATENPVDANSIIENMVKAGAQQVDVFDALKAADPARFTRNSPKP